jgi:hypothetical protein
MKKGRYEVDLPDQGQLKMPGCCIICASQQHENVVVQFSREMGLKKSLLSLGAVGVETTKLDVPLCENHRQQYRAELKKYRVTLVLAFLPCLLLLFGAATMEAFGDFCVPDALDGPLSLLMIMSGISSYLIFRNRSKFFSMRLRLSRRRTALSLPMEAGARALAEANDTTMRET